jgi:UDP-glucose 4-epimerase
LVSKEEMVKAEDIGGYFRIPSDNRDLNYNRYFSDGDECLTEAEEYHSHNTRRLDIQGVKDLLLELDFIQKDLGINKGRAV